MNKNLILVLITAIVAIGAYFFITSQLGDSPATQGTSTETVDSTGTVADA
jgi:hypothetical protein